VRNIDFFNEVTVWAFAELYSAHPLSCTMTFEKLPAELREAIQQHDRRGGLHYFTGTLRWLETNGFIAVGMWTIAGQATQVVLTLQGFRTLSAVPSSLNAGETIGSKMVDLAKSTGKTAWSKAIGELVGTAIGAAGRAMS
jgi:hypothetical protein